MSKKHARRSVLEWVRLGDLRVSDEAQREFKLSHAQKMASNPRFLDQLGYPAVSYRGGCYWIMAGQHRIAALRLLGFSDDDVIECEVFKNLEVEDEANYFLDSDLAKITKAFEAFRIAVRAGRPEESAMEQIAAREGCKFSLSDSTGSVRAVGAARKVYKLAPLTLARTLRILNAAFDGDPSSFKADLLEGMGRVCHRYDGALDEERAINRLRGLPSGPIGLRRKCEALRLKTGRQKADCMAAAIIDTLNSGRGGQKLESWWK